jgi:hypothetical protein
MMISIKISRLALPLLPVVLLVSCATTVEPPKAQLDEARTIAARVPANLLAVLSAELQAKGPAGAIEVCQVKAPEMARNASAQTGWEIRRASLRNRSPKGVPDAWERTALEEFDARRAAGENPATMERAEVVSEGGRQWVRYAKALPTQQLCVQCHGPVAQLGPGVPAKLAALYPNDRATGFTPGQIRGALFLKKPLQ